MSGTPDDNLPLGAEGGAGAGLTPEGSRRERPRRLARWLLIGLAVAVAIPILVTIVLAFLAQVIISH